MQIHEIEECKTLKEYYDKLFVHHAEGLDRDGNEKFIHVKQLHLDLMDLAKESETIRELGTCQGCTLAAMIMQNPKSITGVDLDKKAFDPARKLFEDYAAENEIKFRFLNKSSIDPSTVMPVDLLFIDSLHSPAHLTEELRLHASSVNKYIAFHDTKIRDYGLWKVIERFLNSMPGIGWKLKKHYTEGRQGHVIIERDKL